MVIDNFIEWYGLVWFNMLLYAEFSILDSSVMYELI